MKRKKLKICCVCSGGGHLTEMLEFIACIKEEEIFLVTCYSACEIKEGIFDKIYFVPPPIHSPLNFIKSIFEIFRILIIEKPHLIISTGGEISIIFFYFGKLLFSCKTVYIESVAQVYNSSITGRIVYFVSDLFLVQWKYLLKKYGNKAKYVGGLI